MATDIKLDQGDGHWVLVDGNVLKTSATDFMLDSPLRRLPGGGVFRRALVHDFQDGLTINFNGDYRGGVTVVGKLALAGATPIASVGETITALQAEIASLKRSLAQLAEVAGAVAIPDWRTRTEVEQGDDMGVATPSAEELGLVVEFTIDQRNPNFQHEDVISIAPPAGTFVKRGSTVVVEINLEG